jgi:hypothetical protein
MPFNCCYFNFGNGLNFPFIYLHVKLISIEVSRVRHLERHLFFADAHRQTQLEYCAGDKQVIVIGSNKTGIFIT